MVDGPSLRAAVSLQAGDTHAGACQAGAYRLCWSMLAQVGGGIRADALTGQASTDPTGEGKSWWEASKDGAIPCRAASEVHRPFDLELTAAPSPKPALLRLQ